MNEEKSTVKVMLESLDLTVVEPFRWLYSRDKYFWLDFTYEDIEEFAKSIKVFIYYPVFRMPKPEGGWALNSEYKPHVCEVYLCLVEPNIIHRLVITESDLYTKE